MIITHPNNRKLIEEAFPKQEQGALCFSRDPLYGLPIKFNAFMPERKIRQDWHPPGGGRFVEHGPEDEDWMRPLGLGRIEEVDEGPLIYKTKFDFTFPGQTSCRPYSTIINTTV